MTRVTSTTNTVKAAFSKSVSCTSILRNSVLLIDARKRSVLQVSTSLTKAHYSSSAAVCDSQSQPKSKHNSHAGK
jgi:hypothetical protein